VTSKVEASQSDRARLIAHISGGRPGYARRLVEDESLLDKREERLNDLLTLLSVSRVEKFAYAEKLSRKTRTPCGRRSPSGSPTGGT
jgi:hypothetical protein